MTNKLFEVDVMRALVVAAMAVGVEAMTGCGCGAALQPGYSDAGTVAFDVVTVGKSATLQIPVVANAGTETFTSASVMGTGASDFQVLSTFPLTVTAGSAANVAVQFSPTQVGTASASLVLDTATMGAAVIPIEGTGAASDGG